MKSGTIRRKKARGGFEQAVGREEIVNRMYEIIRVGKQGADGMILELGSMVAEAIMDMEREERSGPEYDPSEEGLYKWAYQDGSIYLEIGRFLSTFSASGAGRRNCITELRGVEETGRLLGRSFEQDVTGVLRTEVSRDTTGDES